MMLAQLASYVIDGCFPIYTYARGRDFFTDFSSQLTLYELEQYFD